MHGLNGLVLWLLIALWLGALWNSPSSILRDLRGVTLQGVRKVMGWQFAVESMASLWLAAWAISQILRRWSRDFLVLEICVAAILLTVAAIYGIAWWRVWKERPSAKVWAVVASLANLLGSIWLISRSWRFASCTWYMAEQGIAGLVLFLWRDGARDGAHGVRVAGDPR